MHDIFASWRVIVVTACVAAVAGLGAGWVGASFSSADQDAFPQMLAQLIDSEHVNLQPDQQHRIDALTQRYLAQRRLTGKQMHAALMELSESMLAEDALGPSSQAAAETVNDIAHLRRIESIQYILEARKVLDPRQRHTFDRNFLEAIATDTSDQDG